MSSSPTFSPSNKQFSYFPLYICKYPLFSPLLFLALPWTAMGELKYQELSKRKSQAVEMERLGSGYGEDCVRKRKRRRKREESEEQVDGGPVRDPLVLFGSDIMMVILGYLDARSVALSLLVSRGWHGVASSDRLWASKCEELWLGKAHIPRLSQVRGLSKLAAYSLSAMDGKRTRIMKEDLWDHGWDFHFNQRAPEYWRNLDPYWRGMGRPMRRYFHPDGSQTADPGDKVWGGHEACYSVVTSFLADGKIRAHYVRINRWPRMSVSRKLDWSWEMSNNLYCYSSIPDADKEGGTGCKLLLHTSIKGQRLDR